MGAGEGFKDYAQKWRDLAGRVQPPLSGPYFNHLIGSSLSGFTELIMTGERIEAGIKSGKIQKGASSSTEKKPFKKESSVVYSSKSQNRPELRQVVNAVVISRPAVTPQRTNQPRAERP